MKMNFWLPLPPSVPCCDPHTHGSPAYANEPALASLELKLLKLIFKFLLFLDLNFS